MCEEECKSCFKNNNLETGNTSKYLGLLSAAHAATSAATETLYGCFARQRNSTIPSGNAPYPMRIPLKQ
jgi:hypothetical protein